MFFFIVIILYVELKYNRLSFRNYVKYICGSKDKTNNIKR